MTIEAWKTVRAGLKVLVSCAMLFVLVSTRLSDGWAWFFAVLGGALVTLDVVTPPHTEENRRSEDARDH